MSWLPDWLGSRSTYAAGVAAAEDCARLARALRQASEEQASLAASARDDWAGLSRDQFDDHLRSARLVAQQLEDQLRQLGANLESQAETVRAEQRGLERQQIVGGPLWDCRSGERQR